MRKLFIAMALAAPAFTVKLGMQPDVMEGVKKAEKMVEQQVHENMSSVKRAEHEFLNKKTAEMLEH